MKVGFCTPINERKLLPTTSYVKSDSHLQVLKRKWPFGRETEWLCRLAAAGQATPIFMSSFAIMAIAVDRYRCIMKPELTQLTAKTSCLISIIMGVVAIGMSIPLFIGRELKDFVDIGPDSNIMICNDVRSGKIRYVVT